MTDEILNVPQLIKVNRNGRQLLDGSVCLKGLPGAMVGTHYHVGTVHDYTMRSHWLYLEHDWIARPGTYMYEPAGEVHTLVIGGCWIRQDRLMPSPFGPCKIWRPPIS